jgi:general secretion pathway protein G
MLLYRKIRKAGDGFSRQSTIDNPQSAVRNRSGMSLIELIIALAILAMLAASVLPLAYNTVKRNREAELRHALRELRSAIDAYKDYHFSTLPPGQLIPIQERTQTGYPKTLEILSEGFVPANRVDDKKKRFLRRMPIDPLTGEAKWGVKSSTDDPDTTSTNGEDVFDVFSLSEGKGLNGTKYKDW